MQSNQIQSVTYQGKRHLNGWEWLTFNRIILDINNWDAIWLFVFMSLLVYLLTWFLFICLPVCLFIELLEINLIIGGWYSFFLRSNIDIIFHYLGRYVGRLII